MKAIFGLLAPALVLFASDCFAQNTKDKTSSAEQPPKQTRNMKNKTANNKKQMPAEKPKSLQKNTGLDNNSPDKFTQPQYGRADFKIGFKTNGKGCAKPEAEPAEPVS